MLCSYMFHIYFIPEMGEVPDLRIENWGRRGGRNILERKCFPLETNISFTKSQFPYDCMLLSCHVSVSE